MEADSAETWESFDSFADVSIGNDWDDMLQEELKQPYFATLAQHIRHDFWALQGQLPIYPPRPLVFRALEFCPLSAVKVVILGQDPYHGHNQAMGLCFSVTRDCPPPPSLRNMMRELERDPNMPFVKPNHGDLTHWAKQGVLLLNAALTVRMGRAASHSGFGWSHFTDAVIRQVSRDTEHTVFLLWGADAQDKARLIDTQRHHVLRTSHPSPNSYTRGFKGCGHFSEANRLLKRHGKTPIDWQI